MSTPKGFDYVLNRNVFWSCKEEKLAFFNKYFRRSDFVKDLVSSELYNFKQSLVGLIEANDKFTVKDILKRLRS